MSDYIHSGSNKMNKVEAYKNDNKLLLADKLGHAKVSSLIEQNLINTINTVASHDTDITQLKTDMNKVRGAYVYKGTVETEYDLPLNNNSVGDVYNVSSTGMNYAWNGENWDELGGTTVSGGNSEWTWNPTPIYEETLSTAYTYAYDEMANSYPLPNTIFGDGLEAIRINIQTPYETPFTGSPFYFLRVTSLLTPNMPTVVYPRINFKSTDLIRRIDFEYQIIKGIGTITSKANTNISGFNSTIIDISEFWPPPLASETGIAPKIFGFAFSGTDLPVGSTIKVYTPNNLTTG